MGSKRHVPTAPNKTATPAPQLQDRRPCAGVNPSQMTVRRQEAPRTGCCPATPRYSSCQMKRRERPSAPLKQGGRRAAIPRSAGVKADLARRGPRPGAGTAYRAPPPPAARRAPRHHDGAAGHPKRRGSRAERPPGSVSRALRGGRGAGPSPARSAARSTGGAGPPG